MLKHITVALMLTTPCFAQDYQDQIDRQQREINQLRQRLDEQKYDSVYEQGRRANEESSRAMDDAVRDFQTRQLRTQQELERSFGPRRY